MTSGDFGSATDSFTAATTDFCQDADGVDNTSTTASDGKPLFANFFFNDSIVSTCTEGGVAADLTMTKGTGIARNTADYMPEIYGQFEVGGAVLDCTLRMVNGVLDASVSSCSDASGSPVAISSTTSCTATNADIARITVPSVIKGHIGINQDEGSNVAYDCWALYPYSQDSDHFLSASSDCSTFANYGFNLEDFSVGIVVGGDSSNWAIYTTSDLAQLASRIKLMHSAGYPVMLEVDVLYVAAYDGTNDEVIGDGTDFPEALIDDATFQQALREKIIDIARVAENLNVEIFAPLSESDRVFSKSTELNPDATFLQSTLSHIQDAYTGELMWIAQFVTSTDTAKYNFTGFDYAGVNISPGPGDDMTTFTDLVVGNLTNLKAVANSFGIPFLISNAGMWGEALTSHSFDWTSDANVLSAFTVFKDESDSMGTAGIIFWEGTTGEIVFSNYPTLSQYIATVLGGDPTAF